MKSAFESITLEQHPTLPVDGSVVGPTFYIDAGKPLAQVEMGDPIVFTEHPVTYLDVIEIASFETFCKTIAHQVITTHLERIP